MLVYGIVSEVCRRHRKSIEFSLRWRNRKRTDSYVIDCTGWNVFVNPNLGGCVATMPHFLGVLPGGPILGVGRFQDPPAFFVAAVVSTFRLYLRRVSFSYMVGDNVC